MCGCAPLIAWLQVFRVTAHSPIVVNRLSPIEHMANLWDTYKLS